MNGKNETPMSLSSCNHSSTITLTTLTLEQTHFKNVPEIKKITFATINREHPTKLKHVQKLK
jgi:hypothetical protein